MTEFQSILFYLVSFFVSFVLVYLGTTGKKRFNYPTVLIPKLFIITGLLIPIIMSGIRYGIGADYFSYETMYNNTFLGEDPWFRSIEPLSHSVIQIAGAFNGGSVMMFTIFSTITVICAYVAICKVSKERYVPLCFFMYLCITFLTTFNAVRSGVAISIIMLAISYIITSGRRSLLKSLACVTIAALFHASSIIIFPVMILQHFYNRNVIAKNTQRIIFVIILAVSILFPMTNQIITVIPMFSDYARYLAGLSDNIDIPIYGLLMVAFLIFGLWVTKKSASSDVQLAKLRSVSMFYFPLLIIVGYMSFYPGLSRLLFYLDPVIILLTPYLLSDLGKVKNAFLTGRSTQILATVFIILFCGAMLMRSATWSQVLPYQTIYQQGEQRAS